MESRAFGDDISLLGRLPPDLRAILQASSPQQHCVTSTLFGVTRVDGSSGAIEVRPDAALHFTDTSRHTRWVAAVRLMTAEAPAKKKEGGDAHEVGVREERREGGSAMCGRLQPSSTLLIEEASWRAETLPAPPLSPAPSQTLAGTTHDAEAAPKQVSSQPAVTPPATPHVADAAALPRPPPPPPRPPPVLAHTSGAMEGAPHASAPASPLTDATAPPSPTATISSLTHTREFHFYADPTLDRTRPHVGAAKMSLWDILTHAGPVSSSTSSPEPFPEPMRDLLEPLILDLVHFLAPAPRSLREVLHFVFGAASSAAAATAAPPSPLYVSLHHCPRSTKYRDCFSLSDVKHLTDLTCRDGALKSSSGSGSPQSSSLLHLAGDGFCFLDIDRYASTLEKQKAANRAYVPLAELVERSVRRAVPPPPPVPPAAGHATGASTASRVAANLPRLVPFGDGAQPLSSIAAPASSLVVKYFSESNVARRMAAMELLVDRDTVLAVKSKGGGIMQGLGRAAATGVAAGVGGGGREGEKAEPAASWLRDGSAPGSEADDVDEAEAEGKAAARHAASAAGTQYTSLQEIRIDWAGGDLTPFLPDRAVPTEVASVLHARRTRRRESHDGSAGRPAKKKHKSDATPPPLPTAAKEAALTLEPLPVADAQAFAAALAEYTVLQTFTSAVAERLRRFQEVHQEAQQWMARVDCARWAPSLHEELRAYFSVNGDKAAWLAAAAAETGAEGYRLERELRDYVCLRELGVLPG